MVRKTLEEREVKAKRVVILTQETEMNHLKEIEVIPASADDLGDKSGSL